MDGCVIKIDLENSPVAAVLMVALVCLVALTLAALIFQNASTPILALAGVWSSLILSCITIGAARGRKNGKSNGT